MPWYSQEEDRVNWLEVGQSKQRRRGLSGYSTNRLKQGNRFPKQRVSYLAAPRAKGSIAEADQIDSRAWS